MGKISYLPAGVGNLAASLADYTRMMLASWLLELGWLRCCREGTEWVCCGEGKDAKFTVFFFGFFFGCGERTVQTDDLAHDDSKMNDSCNMILDNARKVNCAELLTGCKVVTF